jgi:hypothetical protein
LSTGFSRDGRNVIYSLIKRYIVVEFALHQYHIQNYNNIVGTVLYVKRLGFTGPIFGPHGIFSGVALQPPHHPPLLSIKATRSVDKFPQLSIPAFKGKHNFSADVTPSPAVAPVPLTPIYIVNDSLQCHRKPNRGNVTKFWMLDYVLAAVA